MRRVIECNMKTGERKVYKSILATARVHDVSARAIWARLQDNTTLGNYRFEYEDGWPATKKERKVAAKKDVDLNDSFDLRSFDMKYGSICTTPCIRKHKDDGSDIFIGSALCQQCTSFRGINRKKMKVACSFKFIQQINQCCTICMEKST